MVACAVLQLVSVLIIATLAAGDSNNTCDANLCQGVPPKFKLLPGMRVLACQEAGHDNCPIHKVSALSDAHCWKQCESLTSFCRLFTYNAKLGHCYIYDQDFYTSWTSIDVSDSNWTTYYKQRDDGWKLLYKISKGIGIDAVEAYVTSPGQPFASQQLLGKDNSCQCFVKSQVVDHWSKFPITQVSVSLATAGSQVKQITFSGVGETSTSFYKAKNILSSSWTDLNAWTSLWYMSLNEKAGNRGFLIIKNKYAGCDSDLQWISVYTGQSPICNYDLVPPPSLAYAGGSTVGYFSANASYADALMIYAKM